MARVLESNGAAAGWRVGCEGLQRLRYVYSAVLYLMLPLVLARLWWRGRTLAPYRQHWAERLGRSRSRFPARPIWIHAVSVGEVRAAVPLVAELQRGLPRLPVVFTTTTPGGRQTVRDLFGPDQTCVYLPYDLPGAVRRFLDRLAPAAVLMMETELWPNLYHSLRSRGVTLLLANARLSRASLRGYRRLGALTRSTLGCARYVCAQSEADAARFLTLGADPQRVLVCGSLKLDAGLPDRFEQRRSQTDLRLAHAGPVWIAGSTHPGEEAAVLQAHREVIRGYGSALLLLAPRHPERAAAVADLCARAHLSWRRYSHIVGLERGVQVLIVDSFGELATLYGSAAVAFVGGSLVRRGGHNPVEALLAGTPVLSGPHVGNFAQLFEALQREGAARLVAGPETLAEALIAWFDDDASRCNAAAAGRRVIERQRGAAARTVELLKSLTPFVEAQCPDSDRATA
jgi:3-deoxy-D-manno-octulosonic-acid transferase